MNFSNDRTLLLVGLSSVVLAFAGYWYLESGKTEAKDTNPLRSPPPLRDRVAARTGLRFVMKAMPEEYGQAHNLYERGCGVAVGDYNGDGMEDLYFLNQDGTNCLYRNMGKGSFRDVTNETGVAMPNRVCVSAVFVDFDNDRDQDLFVTTVRGGNELFENQGARFSRVTTKAGLDYKGHSQGATFFDFDNDGYLDLYLTNLAAWTDKFDDEKKYYSGNRELKDILELAKCKTEPNILYRNNRDGTFTDVTKVAKVAGRGWSSGSIAFDYDLDGRMDLFVLNMMGPSQLLRNKGDGTFEDVTTLVLGATPFGGSSASLVDHNHDGQLDLLVMDMMSDRWMGEDESHITKNRMFILSREKFRSLFGPDLLSDEQLESLRNLMKLLSYQETEVFYGNALYRSTGKGTFEEVSDSANIETLWPRGTGSGDFNNDGYEDLFVASGVGKPMYHWKNYLMLNTAGGVYRDRSFRGGVDPPRGGPYLSGVHKDHAIARSSRGVAVADLDQDGRLDILVNNYNDRPFLYWNGYTDTRFIQLRLRGSKSNADAIGARVYLIYADGSKQVRLVSSNSGYLSQSTKIVHFGVGARRSVDRIEIHWPSGQVQTIDRPEINVRRTIHEPRKSS